MNENAKKWVAALRSGEYKQTRKRLVSFETPGGAAGGAASNSYCCLGVLCELAAKDKVVHRSSNYTEILKKHGEGYTTKNGGFFAHVPLDVMGWSLATLNDEGSSFAQIADLIESEPEGLFE